MARASVDVISGWPLCLFRAGLKVLTFIPVLISYSKWRGAIRVVNTLTHRISLMIHTDRRDTALAEGPQWGRKRDIVVFSVTGIKPVGGTGLSPTGSVGGFLCVMLRDPFPQVHVRSARSGGMHVTHSVIVGGL